MDRFSKLIELSQASRFDLSCACGPTEARIRSSDENRWIYPATLPDGRSVPLLKVLQSSGCEHDCAYCNERCGGNGKRASFSPDELASVFDSLLRTGKVKGLFLSSAVHKTARHTMDQMLSTVEIVRKKQGFKGFVHLKIIPGAEHSQILRAMEIANRVSVNMEAPTAEALKLIAPSKDLGKNIIDTVKYIGSNLGHRNALCRSQTTQFVVGASDERDRQIVQILWRCYKEMNLSRGYFSAFQPIPGTPLEQRPPAPLMREHRLYQTDFLIRKYGFAAEEIHFDDNGDLPLEKDPKTVWAEKHLDLFPMEINEAPRHMLLRVPGIGPESANRIVALRRRGRIRTIDALRSVSRGWRSAAPFLLLDGRLRASSADRQLRLIF